MNQPIHMPRAHSGIPRRIAMRVELFQKLLDASRGFIASMRARQAALERIRETGSATTGISIEQHLTISAPLFGKALKCGASPRQVLRAAVKNPAYRNAVSNDLLNARWKGGPSRMMGGIPSREETERWAKRELLKAIAISAQGANASTLYSAIKLAYLNKADMYAILHALIPDNCQLATTTQDPLHGPIGATLKADMPGIKSLLDRMSHPFSLFDNQFFINILKDAVDGQAHGLVAAMSYANAQKARFNAGPQPIELPNIV